MLAGMRFDGKDKPMETRRSTLRRPARRLKESGAKLLKDKAASSNALLASLLGGSIVIDDKTKGTVTKATVALAFPREWRKDALPPGRRRHGAAKARRAVAGERHDGPDRADPARRCRRHLSRSNRRYCWSKGFVVKHYGIGKVDVLGSYDADADLWRRSATS